MKNKILICIYTSRADSGLLPDFYNSRVIQALKGNPDVQIIEVYADPLVASDTLQSDKLILKTEEAYSNLSTKTYKMIYFLVKNSSFDYLVKIDVTTLTTALWDSKPTAGKLLDSQEITQLLLSYDFYGHQYNGFAKHIAQRQGVENWATKKSIHIDYQKIFGEDNPPPFYSGKLYLLGRNFAEFIASHGESTMSRFSKYLPAEDLMIGSLYQDFTQQSDLHDFI